MGIFRMPPVNADEVSSSPWQNRYSYLRDLTLTTYSSPQVFWNGSGWQELNFEDHYSTDGYYLLQNAHITAKIYDWYAVFYDPDNLQVCVDDERWVVEVYNEITGNWRYVDLYSPTLSYFNNATHLTVTRTFDCPEGLFNITYVVWQASKMKHEIVFQSRMAGTNEFSVHPKLTGIHHDKVRHKDGTETITTEKHIVTPYFFVGENSSSLVLSEYLWSLGAINETTGEWESDFLKDVVFNTHAKGCKVEIIIGNYTLSQDESLLIDPATSTFYSSSSDGYIRDSDETYITAWGSLTGIISDAGNSATIGQKKTIFVPPTYVIYRSFVFFDTSSLVDDLVIDTAVLGLYGSQDVSASDFNIVVQDGQPTYPHDPLEIGDYSNLHYSGDGGSFSTSSWSTSGYNNISLNSDGKSWIDKTGWTKLCLRSSEDIAMSSPTGSEFVLWYTSEQGSGYQPFLEVTWVVGGPEDDFVDNNTSDVDSSSDIGTHSDFESEKAIDGYDTLTEVSSGGSPGTIELWVNGFTSTEVDWTEAGADPYLDAVEGANYITVSATDVEYESRFNFTDSSDLGAIEDVKICLYAMNDAGDNGQIEVYLYNSTGGPYSVYYPTPNAGSYTWNNQSILSTLSSWSDINVAQLRVRAERAGGADILSVDASLLWVSYSAYNYQLDLEIQWTNVNYTRTNEELCIKTGTTDPEDLKAYAWNVSTLDWHLVFSDLTASSWNNVSVTDWLNSETFTVRFLGGIESSDVNQDSWQIDASLLHTWEEEEEEEEEVDCDWIGLNNTIAGEPTEFSSDWTDLNASDGLSHNLFSTNNTGPWTNDTWTDTWYSGNWTKTTKTLNSTVDTVVAFRFYVNDTSGNEYESTICFITTVGDLMTFDLTCYFLNNTAIESANASLQDNNAVEIFHVQTDANGQITTQTPSYGPNPHTLKVFKEGVRMYTSVFNITTKIDLILTLTARGWTLGTENITYDTLNNIVQVIGFNKTNPCSFQDVVDVNDEQGWGVVDAIGTNQFKFNAQLKIGDPSTVTWFNDTNAQVFFEFDNDCDCPFYPCIHEYLTRTYAIYMKPNSYLTLGELVDAENKVTSGGVSILLGNNTDALLTSDACNLYLYGSYFSSTYEYEGTPASIMLLTTGGGMVVGTNVTLYNVVLSYLSVCELEGYLSVDIHNLELIDTYGLSIDNLGLMPTPPEQSLSGIDVKGTYAFIWMSNQQSPLTIIGLQGKDASESSFYYSAWCNSYVYLVDADLDAWTFEYYDEESTVDTVRQYSFDVTVIYPNGTGTEDANVTVTHYGQGEAQDFTELTNANGQINTKTLSMGFYNQTGGNTIYSYNLHNIVIADVPGYQDYDANFTLDEPSDFTIALTPECIYDVDSPSVRIPQVVELRIVSIAVTPPSISNILRNRSPPIKAYVSLETLMDAKMKAKLDWWVETSEGSVVASGNCTIMLDPPFRSLITRTIPFTIPLDAGETYLFNVQVRIQGLNSEVLSDEFVSVSILDVVLPWVLFGAIVIPVTTVALVRRRRGKQ